MSKHARLEIWANQEDRVTSLPRKGNCISYAVNAKLEETRLICLFHSFYSWGIDVMGQILSKASSRYRFNFVVINYFTKRVKVASYAKVTKSAVIKFKSKSKFKAKSKFKFKAKSKSKSKIKFKFKKKKQKQKKVAIKNAKKKRV
ncbi:Gypsy retrotransposon integrase-like protein 1 [Gossypium australe]|uniref:Gypsy retrotransposon integrase-like protein 1 n=1 Tax=Gossypium australe TaxID=47621 RepID=A0A5B6UHK7_9ROSI|nr:Gypsy retrotransposon integrase-like protein 1 [Gossypium australe]